MNKKILIIYTGGTIGMSYDDGNILINKDNKYLLDILIKKYKPIIDFDFITTNPIIDSSNITIEYWNDLLNIINKNLAKYIGLLIIHGTDTLTYTAAVIQNCIINLNKPIIITGAQYPITTKKTDAFQNLKTSFLIFNTKFIGIGIVFNNQLLSPINTVKQSSYNKNAFINPYEKPLGKYKNNEWNINLTNKKNKSKKTDIKFLNPHINIGCFYLIPGLMLDNIIFNLNNYNFDSIIFLSYGSGNIPSYSKNLINTLEKYNKKNKLLFNISQCLQGESINIYQNNNLFSSIGIINTGKMKIETLYAKILFALSNNYSKEEVIKYIMKK